MECNSHKGLLLCKAAAAAAAAGERIWPDGVNVVKCLRIIMMVMTTVSVMGNFMLFSIVITQGD